MNAVLCGLNGLDRFVGLFPYVDLVPVIIDNFMQVKTIVVPLQHDSTDNPALSAALELNNDANINS